MNEILQITRQQCQIQTPTDPNSLRTVEQLAGSGQCQCALIQLQSREVNSKVSCNAGWQNVITVLSFGFRGERLRGGLRGELQLWLQGHRFNHSHSVISSPSTLAGQVISINIISFQLQQGGWGVKRHLEKFSLNPDICCMGLPSLLLRLNLE